MRVLVAGATGVIGRELIAQLLAEGHEAVALSSKPQHSSPGVEAVTANALDRIELLAAVQSAEPEAVAHLMTAIPKQLNPRRLAADFALTNRLRTEGTRNLVDAAAAVGVKRIVSQGLAYAYRPGGRPARENVRLWTDGPAQFRPVANALVTHELLTREAGGLVMRFGHLYGPGTVFGEGGSFRDSVRGGKVPLVGGGNAVFSFTHTSDAAASIITALNLPAQPGTYNIVDNEPATLATWLPELAAMLDAPAPKRAPALVARMAVGSWGVAYMNELRGADNASAKAQLGWHPRVSSWRQGFKLD